MPMIPAVDATLHDGSRLAYGLDSSHKGLGGVKYPLTVHCHDPTPSLGRKLIQSVCVADACAVQLAHSGSQTVSLRSPCNAGLALDSQHPEGMPSPAQAPAAPPGLDSPPHCCCGDDDAGPLSVGSSNGGFTYSARAARDDQGFVDESLHCDSLSLPISNHRALTKASSVSTATH
jgi:hypothetical protein